MLNRRSLLIAGGSVTAATALGIGPAAAAPGDKLVPGVDDWRQRVLALYFGAGSRSLVVRPLQENLELWELDPAGFMIVDARTSAVLEYSPTAVSPFMGVGGALYYLGIGGYFADDKAKSVNLFTGERGGRANLRAVGADAASIVGERAVVRSEVRQTIDASAPMTPMAAPKPVTSSEVKKRVTSYSAITGCNVYPNTTSVCGWVAGSIVVRYWHVRDTSRILIPSPYRSGTNFDLSHNFASYLQGSSGNTSWALDLKIRLDWHANKQSVPHTVGWSALHHGVTGCINDNKPCIVFGNYPKVTGSGSAAHAVVAYGVTNAGEWIVHYGYSGYTNLVLNEGLTGSNTWFWPK